MHAAPLSKNRVEHVSYAVDAADIAAAAGRLALRRPTDPAAPSQPRLSAALGVPVWLKREDQQISRSYKLRGAFTLISSLTEAERSLGVVCASAGNHALGVAYSCQLLGVRARVFLPTTTPRQKRQQIKAIGGDLVETVVAGHSYDEASASAKADCAATGAIYVHPFDDRRTIAGQGTVGVEITSRWRRPSARSWSPLGGGGLLAGRRHAGSGATRPRPASSAPSRPGAASMTAALRPGDP